MRTRAVLDDTKTPVETLRVSQKQPLDDAEAGALLASVDEIVLARGKSVRVLEASRTTLDDLRGPRGGFRAPILRVGRRLLVGFHEETLRRQIGS